MSGVPTDSGPPVPSQKGPEADGAAGKVEPIELVEIDEAPSRVEGPAPSVPAHAAASPDEIELQEAAEAAAAAGPKRPAKGASRLGLLAVFLGIAACVLCRPSMLPPSVHFRPASFAAAGIVLSFLAFVGIVAGSRAKSGLPLLAILLCLTAIAVSAYEDGARDVASSRAWANKQVETYKTVFINLKNKVAPPTSSTSPADRMARQANPASPNPQPGQALPGVTQVNPPSGPGDFGPATRPRDPDAEIGAGTIFDMRPGSRGSRSTPGSSGSPPAETLPSVLPETPPAVPQAGAPTPGGETK